VEFNKRNVRAILLLVTFAVVLYALVQNLGAVYGAVRRVWNILGTVIGGLFLAFVLNVPLRAFENGVFRRMKQGDRPGRRKLVRPVSLLCALVMAFGIIALVLVVVIPQLSRTAAELADKLPGYITAALAFVGETLGRYGFPAGQLTEFSAGWTGAFDKLADFLGGRDGIIGATTRAGATVVGAAANVVFSIVIAVYVLAKKEGICAFTKRCVNGFLPARASRQVLRIAALADETFSGFISGQLTDSCILAVLCYIGMRIFGFPYPEVIAAVVGVTSLVPMVGSVIGEAVGVFLILLVSPLQALLFLAFILILQQVEGSFIYPKVVGKSVGLPGVLVLCAVITGSRVAGVAGALLSVPVCAVLFTLLREALELQETGSAPPPEHRR
jgi:predicted PurR-regulated permease PerM